MSIVRPVIGIPNYAWKKAAVKYARNNPNVVTIKANDLCHDCDRHRELLKMFDDGRDDYVNSSYFDYSIKQSKKTKEVALKKINKFKNLYLSIKEEIFDCPENRLPIITEDGCRLDGSHKLTIFEHLGVENVSVNLFIYEKVFSKKDAKRLMKDNKEFRYENYNL
jgi:hypothetical protein